MHADLLHLRSSGGLVLSESRNFGECLCNSGKFNRSGSENWINYLIFEQVLQRGMPEKLRVVGARRQ